MRKYKKIEKYRAYSGKNEKCGGEGERKMFMNYIKQTHRLCNEMEVDSQGNWRIAAAAKNRWTIEPILA